MANNNELKNNLMSFKKAFKDYTDCYTVIGGTACFILMDDAGMSFRATHDIDMILVLEEKQKEFGKIFWNYIADDVSSLSAIALDEDFYQFMLNGKTVVNDVSVLHAAYIIPFKMYAWLNNRDLRKSGKAINSDDIKKHKNDVFRLLSLINPDEKINVIGNVKKAVIRFLDEIKEEPVDIKSIGLAITKEEALKILTEIYV